MARIKLPSYIKEGHGRMEDAVIVTMQNGDAYMKVYKKYVSYTEKQIEVRLAFKTLVNDWKYLSGVIHNSWKSYDDDSNASGYNNFMGANVSHRRAGEPVEISREFGEEPLMSFTATPGTDAGEITCEFLPVDEGRHITLFVRKVTDPGVKAPITRYDTGAETASPFTITGLEQGVEYCVYAVVTNARYDQAISVSQSAGMKTNAG